MRPPNRANDYITRAECQALIVHSLNQFLAQMVADAPTVPTPAVVPDEPEPVVS